MTIRKSEKKVFEKVKENAVKKCTEAKNKTPYV